MATPQEPTSEQCSASAPVQFDGLTGFACWYPQMGGYVSHAVVFPVPDPDWPPDEWCFDAWVWHNGDFPFPGEDSADDRAHSPARLHHCEADQFIAFGEMVKAAARGLPAAVALPVADPAPPLAGRDGQQRAE